jgi:hypothetical protein
MAPNWLCKYNIGNLLLFSFNLFGKCHQSGLVGSGSAKSQFSVGNERSYSNFIHGKEKLTEK